MSTNLETGRINALAVDNCPTSERAFKWYLLNYHRANDTLVLVHVHQTPQLPAVGVVAGVNNYNDIVEASVNRSKQVVKRFGDLCKAQNIPCILAVRDSHHALGHTICDLAREHKAEVIITGQRGLGAMKRMLLGSTSDYVLHHAHVPVIVVPPPLEGYRDMLDVNHLCYGGNKEREASMKSLNAQLGKHVHVCGNKFTIADVVTLNSLVSGRATFKTLPKNVKRWFGDVCCSRFASLISSLDLPTVWLQQ